MNESDYYRVARFAGILFWPALLAAVVYIAGRAIAHFRPVAERRKIRGWAAGLAVFFFFVALALSAGDVLQKFGGR